MKTLAPLAAAFTLALSLFAVSSYAAAPAHFWSRHYGGIEGDGVASMAIVPSNGDFVATGFFNQTINFATGHLVSDGASDIWIARFNRKGEAKWAKRFGSSSLDGGTGVAVDAAGNAYFTGNFDGFVDMGGGNLNSIGSSDIFVAKFDPNGNHVWSYGYGGLGYDQASGIAIDGSGNVLVSGNFEGTVNLGGSNVASSGGTDAFIVKYNSSGVFQWNVFGTGSSSDACLGVAADAAGNVYSTGYFSTSMTFSPLAALNSLGSLDIFLVKVNAAGTPQWSFRHGGTLDDAGIAISADASGNLAVTGGIHGTSNVGGSNLISAGGFDGFLAKYNNAGTHQWSLRFGSVNPYEAGNGVFINASGKVFLAAGSATDIGGASGSGDNDLLAAKFGSTGVVTWSKHAGGAGDDRCASIVVDTGETAVVGGFFSQAANFGGGPFLSAGQGDIVFARYGTGEPAVSSIVDVGNDQGRSVRITLSRSLLDDGTAQLPITEYQAFRRILPLPSYASLRRGAQAVPPGTWEHVATVPASNANTYRMIAPTLADSTVADGMYRTKFYVRAATANPSVFFDSPADSGYSLDNLAPGVPANFSYASGSLSWDKSKAGDFDYFTVYGASSNSFGSASVIDYTVAPSLDVTGSPYPYFFVTATDFSGNEGLYAAANAASGVGEGPGRYVLSVSAYPNPFNPETTIRYTLPSRGRVELAVYDLRGERVATLVDREESAGPFRATWNGRNSRGEGVGSGVYFARLKTPAGDRSYKLILVK